MVDDPVVSDCALATPMLRLLDGRTGDGEACEINEVFGVGGKESFGSVLALPVFDLLGLGLGLGDDLHTGIFDGLGLDLEEREDRGRISGALFVTSSSNKSPSSSNNSLNEFSPNELISWLIGA